MRFHHSTRRGRNRLSQHNQHQSSYRSSHHSTSRWAQLGYCRETNIHFNRRLPVDLPPVECLLASRRLWSTSVDSGQLESEEADEEKDLIQDRLLELSLEEQNKKTTRKQSARQQQHQQSKLDMESAREKLVAQVEKHPFWSSKAAKRMQLTGVEERRVYIYELISFCERRDLEWRYEPYRGGSLASSVPFRRIDLTGGSGSQPSTPVRASTALATPSSISSEQASPTSPDSLVFSRSIPHLNSSGISSIHRSNSGTASNKSTRYEPMSAIERLEPSPQHIWALPTPSIQPEAFAGHTHSAELANSSFVKRCHGCQGRGRLKCTSCYGVGYEVCISCSGKGTTKSLCSSARTSALASQSDHPNSRNSMYANGYDQDSADCSPFSSSRDQCKRSNEPGGISSASGSVSASAWTAEACHFCHGAGQKRCWVCAGKSFNHCMGCLGSGQLRCYLNLNITWLNHRDECILNNSDAIIPRDRLRLCSGLVLVDECADSLGALQRARIDGATGQAEQSNQLHLASKKLLDKHQQSFRQERLLKQRHKVTLVECHIVNYEWKQRRGHFVIYGDERKVYIAKYPFKSLCNIT